MKNILLIDGNNLYARGYFFAKTRQEHPVEYVTGMVCNLREKFPDARLVFTFDTTKSARRLALFQGYKAGRRNKMSEEDYKDFQDNLHILIKLTKFSGFSSIFGEGYEADDYLACLSQMLKMRYNVILVTTDKDMYQLIDRYVRVWEPMKHIMINDENFESIMEVPLKHFLDYKIIVGDSSDSIPGVDGIADKRAKKLIYAHGSINQIFEAISSETNPGKLGQSFMTAVNSGLIDRNRELVDLSIPIKDPALREIIKAKVQATKNPELLNLLLAKSNLGHIYGTWERQCLRT